MTSISSGVSSVGGWGGMPPPSRMQGKGVEGQSGAASMQALFSKLDGDGDGSISQSELAQGLKPSSSSGQDAGSCQQVMQQGGQNGFGGMGMDTQGFASMMVGGIGGDMQGMSGMPPPAPQGDMNGLAGGGFSLNQLDSDEDGSITMAEFGLTDSTSSASISAAADDSASGTSTSSASSRQQALFGMIDSDQSGDLSKTELNSFHDKMKALFETMQMDHSSTRGNAASGISLNA